MKLKIIGLSLVISIICIVAIINSSKAEPKATGQQIEDLETQQKNYGLTIHERVKLAKARNEKKIVVPKSYGNSLYASLSNIDTVAAVYTIVTAKPVTLVTRLSERGEIVTSYRFKTIEIISEPSSPKTPYAFHGSFPSELGTFENGDFLVTTLGGTKNIDNVEVTSKYDDFDIFSLDKEYLLFLDFDASKTVGGLDMGPLSALEINSDGTMDTLDRQQTHAIKQVVNSRFGNSVRVLKSYLNNKASR